MVQTSDILYVVVKNLTIYIYRTYIYILFNEISASKQANTNLSWYKKKVIS